MTCVAAVVKDGVVYMGADSAGANSSFSLSVRADTKVFRSNFTGVQFVFGFTTSFRMGQLLRYKLDLPERADHTTLDKYMATIFVDRVRKTLKEGGFASKDNEVERGGTFLVGTEGRLFTVGDDYQVAEHVDPMAACGCGEDLALGSLFTTRFTDPPSSIADKPIEAIVMALRAAERWSAGVRGPFHVVRSDGAPSFTFH